MTQDKLTEAWLTLAQLFELQAGETLLMAAAKALAKHAYAHGPSAAVVLAAKRVLRVTAAEWSGLPPNDTLEAIARDARGSGGARRPQLRLVKPKRSK